MINSSDCDIIVIGGGLAGLTTALHLSKNNVKVCLIEKNPIPNHKVCGEYVSNEVLPYLNKLGIDPFAHGATAIEKFTITDCNGTSLNAALPLGGFGISRFAFDNLIYKAVQKTTTVIFDTVTTIDFKKDYFTIKTKNGQSLNAEFVVGAFGKRSNLDVSMKRKFISQHSPWLAVKNHYEYDFPKNKVALHNFKGGYCGLSKTETNVVNACYLTTLKSFKKYNDINSFQLMEMSRNPYLKDFFDTAKPLFEKPLAISQISFEKKSTIEDHVFMVGDTAGLIHPLCGNGMAMAIGSAKIFCNLYLKARNKGPINRAELEKAYSLCWAAEFNKRMKTGRWIQKTVQYPFWLKLGFLTANTFPSLIPHIIAKTHGTLSHDKIQ